MSEESEGKPPERGQDEVGPNPDPPAGDQPAAAPSPEKKKRFRRSKKSKLLDEAREDPALTRWTFFKGLADDAVRFVVRGRGIGSTSGDGEALGLAMQRYAKMLRVLDADTQVGGLAFGNSAIIEFRASAAELQRAQAARQEAERLIAGAVPDESSLSVELSALELDERLERLPEKQRKEFENAMRAGVTNLQVAAAAAARLIAAPASAAPKEAVAYGVEVAEAYRGLARAVSRSNLELEIESPGEESVNLDAEKATRVVEELRLASEPTSETITVFGVLSQADQEVRGFGLRLAPDAARPSELKGKRLLKGTYRPDAGVAIRDQGLWGKEVRARVFVERDALISTSTIRPATYTLMSVEPRYT